MKAPAADTKAVLAHQRTSNPIAENHQSKKTAVRPITNLPSETNTVHRRAAEPVAIAHIRINEVAMTRETINIVPKVRNRLRKTTITQVTNRSRRHVNALIRKIRMMELIPAVAIRLYQIKPSMVIRKIRQATIKRVAAMEMVPRHQLIICPLLCH